MGQEVHYAEGRRAYWSGVKHEQNPYPAKDDQGVYWLMGWIDEARAYMKLMQRALTLKEVA